MVNEFNRGGILMQRALLVYFYFLFTMNI